MRDDLPPRMLDDVAAHARAARRLARSLVRDPDEADDVAQESLRVALARPAAPGRPAWPWLAGIVRRVSYAARRRRRRAGVALPLLASDDADPARLALAVEAQRRVLDAVLRLDEPLRGTVILRYVRDLSPPEVAAMQGVPVETVRTRLRRALARLRHDLDALHGGDRRAWTAALSPLLVPEGGAVAPAAAATAFAGAVAMKKVVLALAALLLLGGGAWLVLERPGREATSGVAAPDAAPTEGARLAGASEGAADPAATAGAARTGQPAILGRVVGAGRRPVAGALVRATPKDGAPLEARTDAEGRFRLAATPQEHRVVARDDAGLAAFSRAWPQDGKDSDVGTLALRPATSVRVRVTRDGAPVAGARVLARGNDHSLDDLLEARTDAEGLARLEPLPLRPVRLVATAEGHGRGTLATPLPLEGNPLLEVALSEPRDLDVVFVEKETGRPVPGIEVEVNESREPSGGRPGLGFWYLPRIVVAPTDATGRTRVAGLGTDADLFLVWRFGDLPKPRTTWPDSPTVVHVPRTQREVRVEVAPRATERWRIATNRNEVPAPRPGALLRVRLGDDMEREVAMTARVDGRDVVVEGVPDGPFDGYAIAEDGSAMAWLPRTHDHRPGAYLPTHFVRPRTLEVVVRGVDGPSREATALTLYDEAMRPVARGTLADGRATIGGLAPGRRTVLASTGDPLGQTTLGVVDLTTGDARLDVVLEETVRVTVLVEIDGKPALPDEWTITVGGIGTTRGVEDPVRGSVEIRARPTRGVVALELRARGFAPVEGRAAVGEPVRVRLRRTAAARIAVRPPSDAEYELQLERLDDETGEWERAAMGTIDPRPTADGSHRAEGLEEGRYRVLDSRSGADTEPFEVRGAALVEGVALDLSNGGWVRGHVTLPEGVSPREAQVQVADLERTPGEHLRRTGVQPDGTFSVRVPGDRQVVLRPFHPTLSPAPGAEGAAAATAPRDGVRLRLVPGPVATLRFEPPVEFPGGGTTFPPRIRLYRGEPSDPSVLDLYVRGSRYPIDEVRFGGFEPGRYTLRVDAPDRPPTTLRDVDLGPGTTDLGTIARPEGSDLRVRLVAEDGQAVPAVAVFVTSLDVPRHRRSVHARGEREVVVPALGAGRFVVSVSAGLGRFQRRETVEMDGRTERVLEVDLRR